MRPLSMSRALPALVLGLVFVVFIACSVPILGSERVIGGYTVVVDGPVSETVWAAHHIESMRPFTLVFGEPQEFRQGQVIEVQGAVLSSVVDGTLVQVRILNVDCAQSVSRAPEGPDPVLPPPDLAPPLPKDTVTVQGEITGSSGEDFYLLSPEGQPSSPPYYLRMNNRQPCRGRRVVVQAVVEDDLVDGLQVLNPIDMWAPEPDEVDGATLATLFREARVAGLEPQSRQVIVEVFGLPRLNTLDLSYLFWVGNELGGAAVHPVGMEILYDRATERQTIVAYLKDPISENPGRWVLRVWPFGRPDDAVHIPLWTVP